MRIDSYRSGKIVINWVSYYRDIQVFPERIVTDWWRRKGHLLHVEDMEDVFSCDVNLIVVGTGMLGAMKVSEDVKEKAKEKSIELLIEKTAKAVNLFNEKFRLKKTVGLFHLTC
ncbi:MAG: MTH938/NDUFAF3 family protein [Candidatus Aminicenantia bacterium]